MLFDSHAHVNFGEFNDDWKAVVDDCQKNNVWFVNVGSQYATSKKGIEIAEQYEKGVYAAVSLHPIHVEGSSFHPEGFNPEEYATLIESSKKVVAVGETGIDFFHDDNNLEAQRLVFAQHIELAKKYSLPVIIHGRNSRDGSKLAYQEILRIVKENNVTRGVIHCFGGTVEEALAFTEQGLYVGFTGILTFDKTGALEKVVAALPLEKILIETDSPYLAPAPNRGKRNQPQYVQHVAKKIAEIKKMSYEEIADVTTRNAAELFAVTL